MSGVSERPGAKPAISSSPEARAALEAASEWRLLGLLLERPRDGWMQELEKLAREVRDPALQRTVAAAKESSAGPYLAVFGPGGAVSPREVAYRGREDPGRIVADINIFYEAFAFRPRAEDPPDHVAVEVGFTGYLRLKEAFARALGDDEAADIAAKAFDRFVAAHLRCFVEPLCLRLESAPVAHLVLAARALTERTGPAPALYRDAYPADGEDDLLHCDGCAGAGSGASALARETVVFRLPPETERIPGCAE